MKAALLWGLVVTEALAVMFFFTFLVGEIRNVRRGRELEPQAVSILILAVLPVVISVGAVWWACGPVYVLVGLAVAAAWGGLIWGVDATVRAVFNVFNRRNEKKVKG